MKTTLKSRLYLGFTFALLLSAVIGASSYLTFRRQADDANWVKHTYQVISTIENLEKTLVDMETGRRGFRTTNDKNFLQPYYEGVRSIGPSMQSLEKLVADNKIQFHKVEMLRDSIGGLLNFWNTLGEDASDYTREGISDIMYREKRHMDGLRRLLASILDTERRYLQEREQKSSSVIRFATWEIILGTLFVMGIIVVLIIVIFREFNERRKAQLALNESMSELKVLNQATEEKNWQLIGVSEVNDAMQGVDETRQLARLIVDTLSNYLQLPGAAIYLYEEKENVLRLTASNALPPQAKTDYRIGEGLPGEAARTSNIRVIREVPQQYWTLESAMGSGPASEIMYVPLWYNKELKGVLELVSFSPFTEQHLGLMTVISKNVSVAFNASDARERVMELLEQVQEQREVLQNQQEELRQSNEELTRQAEVLQASEEELRVQEEELRQINAELEERNEAVELASQALAMKARELELTGKYKSEFLANMSHELRTPLNSVLILARLLSENKTQNLTDKQVEYATVIHKSGSDLLNLINDILDLSKIEAGKIDLNFEAVRVTDMVEDLRQLFVVIAEEKGVEFTGIVRENVPATITTDKVRLEQVIRNLLSNAFKFTSQGGSVELEFYVPQRGAYPISDTLSRAAGVIAVSVKDSGIGIPHEKHQLIFEAFQQADGSTSRKYGGTGLGLSISKELIRKLGGEITLHSEEGKGSLFTIYIPADKPVFAGSDTTPKKERDNNMPVLPEFPVREQELVRDDRSDLNKGDKVMLIIEDDPYFASLVQDFARGKDYKTVVAVQGDEGLVYARRYKPTAIILDMQLPVIDGWNLLKMLKNDEGLKNIPVHIISAAEEPKLSLGGALAYLRKPLEKEDLEGAFELIEEHLDSKVKKVLVLSGDYLQSESLKKRIEERDFDMSCVYVPSVAQALDMLKKQSFDCVIADIGRNLEPGIEALQQLRGQTGETGIPLIAYLDTTIDSADELRLKKVSDVIIQESSQSIDRLMDELELFLYKVQEPVQPMGFPPLVENMGADASLHGKKVLLVDDDMRNVFALSMLLEQHQMEVVTAGDGKEALQRLQEQPDIDIVLMDIMMPEMDGYEATRHIRSNPLLKDLPVIALTAKAMSGDREKSIEAGASDYITKPVDSQRLFSLMRVWLSK